MAHAALKKPRPTFCKIIAVYELKLSLNVLSEKERTFWTFKVLLQTRYIYICRVSQQLQLTCLLCIQCFMSIVHWSLLHDEKIGVWVKMSLRHIIKPIFTFRTIKSQWYCDNILYNFIAQNWQKMIFSV